MMYRWKIYPTLYVVVFTIIFNNKMMKVAKILCQHYHFCFFTSAYQYLPIKDRQPTLHVTSSYCFYNLSVELSKNGRYIQHSTLSFHTQIRCTINDYTRNITEIYVSTIGNSLQFWVLVYKFKIYPTQNIGFFIIIFKNIMMKSRKNSMLSNPDYIQQQRCHDFRHLCQH